MSNIAIRVSAVTKKYEVYRKPIDLALEVLTRRVRHETFTALEGVSFDVLKGEVFGIIGANGAGKSTLLKIITGVLDATSGDVEISGRVTAILELGLGFNPEYSGRENIYLSGLLYGMNRAEVDGKLNSIIQFSGLREFIDRPVKTYSSGMHSRLAFSIATAVEPDILIIDEALAAGDAMFVQKCLRRIRQLCSGGRTVLLVSHGTGIVAQLCHRVLWIDAGKMRAIGEAIPVVQAYDLAAHQASDDASWLETVDDLQGPTDSAPNTLAADGVDPASAGSSEADPTGAELSSSGRIQGTFGTATGRDVFRRGPVFIDQVELLDENNRAANHLTLLKRFSVRVSYHTGGNTSGQSLGIALAINNRADLAPIAQYYTQNIRPTETRETYADAPDRLIAAHRGTVVLDFDYLPLKKGEYILSLGLLPNEPTTWDFYEYRHLFYTFHVDDAGMDLGAPIYLQPSVKHLAEFPDIRTTMPPGSVSKKVSSKSQ